MRKLSIYRNWLDANQGGGRQPSLAGDGWSGSILSSTLPPCSPAVAESQEATVGSLAFILCICPQSACHQLRLGAVIHTYAARLDARARREVTPGSRDTQRRQQGSGTLFLFGVDRPGQLARPRAHRSSCPPHPAPSPPPFPTSIPLSPRGVPCWWSCQRSATFCLDEAVVVASALLRGMMNVRRDVFEAARRWAGSQAARQRGCQTGQVAGRQRQRADKLQLLQPVSSRTLTSQNAAIVQTMKYHIMLCYCKLILMACFGIILTHKVIAPTLKPYQNL